MQSQSHDFKQRATVALQDVQLQKAMANAKTGFIDKRRNAVQALPEFEALRTRAKEIKEHTLSHLDFYLEQFEKQVIASGGQVHWADTAETARTIIVKLCQQANAKVITKGKSMIGEEIAINEALEANHFEVVETDLGEYIIQLAKEPPSHIIAPAVHKTREQITELFHQHHQQYGLTEKQTERAALVNEARQVLRKKYLAADVGITGANFLVAETGSTVIVTNEGNGDLTNCLPRVHIVTASIDKVIPTLEDMTTIIRLLGRSATGQEMTAYTTLTTGIKQTGDLSGVSEFHVVLLDNGRSRMLGNEFHDMLRCIRCGACLNHCPVYGSIGGHAYGWVYPGPMGSVLTPIMLGLQEAGDLPNACTLNGRCQQVCPMSIPLPTMLRHHRIRQFKQGLVHGRTRWALQLWVFFAKHPVLYQLSTATKARLLGWLGKKRGYFSHLPFASAWTATRDMPAPQGETFMAQWKRLNKGLNK
ncbi:LutB/LldF family L-lactate oxidation iron-sulfur protein [Beggiatoa leptomitoformis]|uniref:Iron-sulfur cluster-binding protein n=1 Tax=Beggiatoa leptomitoformis TaxID=288004 RepID=A0A2N9YAD8_9GAMM|nr:LutB/LldF family L-lactate oxidation iron-sulfur protein [Beggiatoa leptomitoformis]ALG67189.1 iron-sulfur cluster-binding protein [Beggiatoa leptomitoformis]AUI67404.1 iron-sulfur cluster-binding protein [Beggiatoa leptomitoformis]